MLSLYARGLTTGDIAAHFAEIYDAQVSKDTISRITDRVVEEMQAWTSGPLERIYAAVVLDAINVKVRDGQVANRPVYAAIGSTWRATRTSWACGSATAAGAGSIGSSPGTAARSSTAGSSANVPLAPGAHHRVRYGAHRQAPGRTQAAPMAISGLVHLSWTIARAGRKPCNWVLDNYGRRGLSGR